MWVDFSVKHRPKCSRRAIYCISARIKCSSKCENKKRTNLSICPLSSGGRTRTSDLWVMSPTSCQLLHSAIIRFRNSLLGSGSIAPPLSAGFHLSRSCYFVFVGAKVSKKNGTTKSNCKKRVKKFDNRPENPLWRLFMLARRSRTNRDIRTSRHARNAPR